MGNFNLKNLKNNGSDDENENGDIENKIEIKYKDFIY